MFRTIDSNGWLGNRLAWAHSLRGKRGKFTNYLRDECEVRSSILRLYLWDMWFRWRVFGPFTPFGLLVTVTIASLVLVPGTGPFFLWVLKFLAQAGLIILVAVAILALLALLLLIPTYAWNEWLRYTHLVMAIEEFLDRPSRIVNMKRGQFWWLLFVLAFLVVIGVVEPLIFVIIGAFVVLAVLTIIVLTVIRVVEDADIDLKSELKHSDIGIVKGFFEFVCRPVTFK